MKAPPLHGGRGTPPGRHRSIHRPPGPPEPRVAPGRRRRASTAAAGNGGSACSPPGYRLLPSDTGLGRQSSQAAGKGCCARGWGSRAVKCRGRGLLGRGLLHGAWAAEPANEGPLHQQKTGMLSHGSSLGTVGTPRRAAGTRATPCVQHRYVHLRSVPMHAVALVGRMKRLEITEKKKMGKQQKFCDRKYK